MEEAHPDLPQRRSLNDGLRRALADGQALFDRGLYFEAHERLEEEWHKQSGPAKRLLQGLTQICAGCHKMKSGADPKAGALYLLERGLEKTMKAAGLLAPGTAAPLEKTIKALVAAIRNGERPKPPELRWI